MYDIIKTVIESKRYELTDMLSKIDSIWLMGNLSDEQRAELVELAREHAAPSNSYASVQQQLKGMFANMTEIAEKINKLSDRITALEGGVVETPSEPDEWPEYVQPIGAHDAYKIGDKITYGGQHYVCRMDGCVWTPDVYPAGWELVEQAS